MVVICDKELKENGELIRLPEGLVLNEALRFRSPIVDIIASFIQQCVLLVYSSTGRTCPCLGLSSNDEQEKNKMSCPRKLSRKIYAR